MKRFDKIQRVKAVARVRVGSPKPGRTLTERTRKSKPKHKPDFREVE